MKLGEGDFFFCGRVAGCICFQCIFIDQSGELKPPEICFQSRIRFEFWRELSYFDDNLEYT